MNNICMNKYGEDLKKIFNDKYSKIDSFVVFCEYLGDGSFSGQHISSDIKDVILFDVNQYKRGFIPPKEFIDNFGSLHIPKVVYHGKYDVDLINSVRNNKFNLFEGVVAKGIDGKNIWMTKIKTNEWLLKVKSIYGEKKLLEELNNDVSLMI